MEVKHKNPCKECPFRKDSMRGWLGGTSPVKFIHVATAEGGMPCHMGNEYQIKMKGVPACAGSLIHANMSCKVYRNPEMRKLQNSVPMSDPNVLSNAVEFVKHHNPRGIWDDEIKMMGLMVNPPK